MWNLLAFLWFLLTLLVGGFLLLIGLFGGTTQVFEAPPVEVMPPVNGTVMDQIEANPELSTLKTALEVAGLDATLRGEGEFTLFLPNNAAFEALPNGTLDAVLADVPLLTDILLFHAALGSYSAEDVIQLDELEMINGQILSIELEDDGSVYVNGAQILVTDLPASNGVIHIIDAVLIPSQG